MYRKLKQCCLATAVGFLSVIIMAGCKPESAVPGAPDTQREPISVPPLQGITQTANDSPQEALTGTVQAPETILAAPEPQVVEELAERPQELVRNGSFEYWNEKGWPAQWSVRTGQVELTDDAAAGDSAAKLTLAEGSEDASLRTVITVPEGSGGKTLKLTLQAKAPQDTLRVFIGTDESGIGRLRAQTNPDSYTAGILRVDLPEDVGPELWLLVNADLDEGEVAYIDEVSVTLLPAQ